jgi:hypothetical protein
MFTCSVKKHENVCQGHLAIGEIAFSPDAQRRSTSRSSSFFQALTKPRKLHRTIKMKLDILSFILLVTAAAPTAAQRFAIRTTFASTNGPQECSAADMEIVQDSCWAAITGANNSPQRKLRARTLPELQSSATSQQGRQLYSLSQCIDLCLGWPRSQYVQFLMIYTIHAG